MEGIMRFKYLTLVIALLLAVGIWQVRAAPQPGARPPSSPDNAALLKHGEYLVSSVAMCSHCHTAHDAKGQPDQSRFLQGAMLDIAPKQKTPNWAEQSPNITSSGLAGKWSEEQLIRFLMTGIDPGGKQARAPMPPFRFNATDARAVTLYLKSLGGSKRSGTKVGTNPE